jgi:hypothetical protein
MRILGLIFLILGLVAAFKAINTPVRPSGNAAYDQGGQIGRVGAPVVLIGLGLGLLLRRADRTTPSRSVTATHYQRPVVPPAVYPAAMPVKINCGCGQHYSFDVEPVAGRMPTPVACPTCGMDGTDAANASIAQTLAQRVAAPAWAPQPPARRRLHPAMWVGVAVAALLCLLVASAFVRNLLRFNRARSNQPPTYASYVRPNSSPNPAPGVIPRKTSPRSKAGTVRDAAPVPPDATSIEVFWGSRWYPATILRRDGPRAFIRYEGWSASFDEWVTPERMRPRR